MKGIKKKKNKRKSGTQVSETVAGGRIGLGTSPAFRAAVEECRIIEGISVSNFLRRLLLMGYNEYRRTGILQEIERGSILHVERGTQRAFKLVPIFQDDKEQ